MSTVITDEIAGRGDSNHVIAVPNNVTLYTPGAVIQTAWRKMDFHATYSSLNDNVSRAISGLDLTVTLKRSNSLVYIQWWLFYECHHNITFQAIRNGTVVGFNTEVGNVRWSGIGSAEFEHSHDQNSTPSYAHFCYTDTPGSVGPHTYSLGSRGSGATSYEIRVNRAWGNFTDDFEGGVSWAMIQEIAV
jgi:hypothetical protein